MNHVIVVQYGCALDMATASCLLAYYNNIVIDIVITYYNNIKSILQSKSSMVLIIFSKSCQTNDLV